MLHSYDDLTLNGLSPADIANLIKEKQSHDRAFADFELHNIGSSADVRVNVSETVCAYVIHRIIISWGTLEANKIAWEIIAHMGTHRSKRNKDC